MRLSKGSDAARLVAAGMFFLMVAATATAQIAPTKRYLMAFHGCEGTLCSSPTNHRVYLAESNDGASWTMVPGWTSFAGSVPDVIQRGRTLYIFTASQEVARYNLDTGASDRVRMTVSGLPSGVSSDWVDPSLYIDEQGRLVLFLLYAPFGGGDPARCATGIASCTKQFMSATEVTGSNGGQFAVDPGTRATITVTSTALPSSASDPDIFFGGTQYVMYISHGSSISVWTSSSLRGTFTQSTTLPGGLLADGTGGVPAGHFDGATSQYWTYAHVTQGNPATSVTRRAVHSGFSQQLTASSWTTVVTGSGIGLGSSTSVESPSFTVLSSGLPTAPSSLAHTLSGSTVTLTWNASVNASSYDVEVGSRSGAADLTTLSTTEATLSGTAANGTYYVRVRGRNGSGTSAASNEATITVGSTCSALTAPGPLTSTVVGSTVALVWGGVGGASSYFVEAGSSAGSANIVTFDTGSSATSYTASGVGRGTYFVRVRAKNACTTSAASNEATIVVQ